ncbi:unnamed protein product, partial [Didymodactylos carnosus]
DQAPSDRTILNWYHEFQRNNLSVEDAARSGYPRTAVNDETIDAVRAIIEDDPHSTYEQIQDSLGITSSSINSIIHDYSNLHEVCARWVPHQLTDDEKQFCIQFCRDSMERFEGGQSRRVFDIITADESWLIQQQKSNQKFGCHKLIYDQPKFIDTKVQASQANGGDFLHDIRFNQVHTIGTWWDGNCKMLRGIQFNDDNAMLNALEQAIDNQLTKDDFKNCFDDWFIRMDKCIDADGQYF